MWYHNTMTLYLFLFHNLKWYYTTAFQIMVLLIVLWYHSMYYEIIVLQYYSQYPIWHHSLPFMIYSSSDIILLWCLHGMEFQKLLCPSKGFGLFPPLCVSPVTLPRPTSSQLISTSRRTMHITQYSIKSGIFLFTVYSIYLHITPDQQKLATLLGGMLQAPPWEVCTA
jgi:hypothetical protein